MRIWCIVFSLLLVLLVWMRPGWTQGVCNTDGLCEFSGGPGWENEILPSAAFSQTVRRRHKNVVLPVLPIQRAPNGRFSVVSVN